MSRDSDSRQSYRCVIAAENGAAKLKINRRAIDCQVLDTSRESFGIRLSNKFSRKILQRKPRLELHFQGEQWEVAVISHFNEDPQYVHVGLARTRDLTKFSVQQSWSGSAPKFSTSTDPSFLLALMVAFLLCCACLPGIGDNLGTATRIREGVSQMVEYVSKAVN